MSRPVVTRVASGTYRVEHDGRTELVYVAGPSSAPWAFWNGELFHFDRAQDVATSGSRMPAQQSLRAPMPATVVNVLAKPGSAVKSGDALIVLEAMKMELVLRAPIDGIVAAVFCREKDLVQPDTVLLEFA